MATLARRRAPLIIANPTESESDDSGSDDPHHAFNAFHSIDPPAPVVGHSSSQSSIPPDDVSGSSRSSPAPDTTPPRTPGTSLPPVNLAGDLLDPHTSPKDRPYHHHHPHQDRDTDMHGIGRAPLHIRRPSNEPQNTSSPILSISQSYSPLSPTELLEPRMIMATADSDVWIKVNITSAQNGEAIRELIFSALQIADEDQLDFSLFQTELGESAIGEDLSNDQLYDMCSRSADRKGTLKFIIQRSSSQIYHRPDIRALPIPPPPTTVPPLPKAPPPQLAVVPTQFRPVTRNGRSPQSQHDTASSTSERRNDFGGGYDASLSDDFEGQDAARRRAGPLRTQHSYQQLSRPTQALQPAVQRPSVGIHRVPRNAIVKRISPIDNFPPVNGRGTSPLHISPGGLSNGTSDSSSSHNQNHLHHLQHVPSVAPLQIDRRGSITPTPPMHGGYGASLSPPQSRDGLTHMRKTSETAAERERALEQSEMRERAQSQSRRRERERRERERDKEQTQQMRSEETQRWRQQQQAILDRNGDSSSPSDTLSPGGFERMEVRSRPGTTGTVAARYRDVSQDRDRPSTAQPVLGGRMYGGNQPYHGRGPPPVLLPGGARPGTASSTGSTTGPRGADTPRGLQPAYRGHPPQTAPQDYGRTLSPPERGQAVPPNWMVGWRADGRTAPLQQPHRMPMAKSMDNLRHQYSASQGNKLYPLKLQTGRRLPTPTSQRTAPNNYGGPSEYGSSTVSPQYSSPTLPYHDQQARPYTSQSRMNGVSSGTNTPLDYNSRGPVPWREREERPRSPPYERGSPGIGVFRHEGEMREPRPPYVPPPPARPENIVRGDHAGSFGQAAQNLSPGLGAGRGLLDTAPTLPSPLEPSDNTTESTLQPQEHQWIVDLLNHGESLGLPAQTGSEESTVVPAGKYGTPKATSPQTPVGTSSAAPHEEYDSEDEYSEEESETGTLWQPIKKKRASKVPSLHPIQTGVPAIPPVPPIPPPQPPYRGKTSRLSPNGNVNRHSSFTKRDSVTWAFRPPPEDINERLEEFFPDHDLDKPVIDAAPSGGSSPTQAEHPPPPAFPPPSRARHKKSIRVVVSDRKSKMGSPTAQNMLRKRSTKLWGSRVEEVTPAQAKGGALSAAPESPPGVPNPKPLFKWVKGELIGKGTYGRVYLALNATTGEMIAVKQVELPRTVSDQADSRQLQVVDALKSESDTLRELDHPNVVQYLGLEQSTEFMSIFLEYVPGGSIGGCLRKQGKFDHEVVRSFTSQMLAGLEYLHSRGVLHRDLKADNILLDPSGVCKISDFGISKRSADIYDNDTALTVMQGSVFWMAPEVLHNNKQGYNAKIDIWSLGCVVLEMWAGRRPWNQEDIVAVMFKLGASREAPPVPDDVELDAIEDDFRRQCFAVNPNERPTAAELRKHRFLELKPGWVFTGFT